MTVLLKLTFAAAALSAATLPAFAEKQDDDTIVTAERREDTISTNVYYSDLNLASAAGVERLETRVRVAARRICYSNGLRPLSVWMLERNCYREAIDGAAPQIADAVRNYGTALAASAPTIKLIRRKG